MKQSWVWSLVVLVVVSLISYGVFRATRPAEVPEGFIYGNGHIEGTEVRIASEWRAATSRNYSASATRST